MKAFEFTSPGRVIFGRGSFKRIGEIASECGRRALVVTNADRAGQLGLLDKLTELLRASGVETTVLRVAGELAAQDVDRGVLAARAAQSELLLALGGGSALDAAKAIAGIVTNGGVATDYMEVVGKAQKMTRPALPWIAVPTTAGTGAEATRNAVVAYPEKQFKASIRSPHLLPRTALIDAELQTHVRPEITARAGMDALTQLIESYTSQGATAITDPLAMQGLGLAARALPRVYRDGGDLDAREDMALAAFLSGVTLNNAGLGAVHGFASPLGARFPAPHGAVCAVLLPKVLAANIEELRRTGSNPTALARYAMIGLRLVGDITLPQEALLQACVDVTAKWVAEFKIPGLSAYGMTEREIPELVALAQKSNSMRYNPVPLAPELMAELLRQAL